MHRLRILRSLRGSAPSPQKPPKAGLRSVIIEWARRKSRTRLKKPAKTREELESAIRLEMDDICEWPTGLAISVAPHEDSWKVVIMTDVPQDADRCHMIETIAQRLRGQFDLKS